MLSIQNLTAGYAGRAVLHDFSLEVGPTQIAAIIGPNGCGKSTLLRCLAGLLKPMAGSIQFEARDIYSWTARDRARRIALLPQQYSGGQGLTAGEMVVLGRTPHLPPYGSLSSRDVSISESALAAVGAEHLRDRLVSELSGGERQRVIIARALAQEPKVLLLDEPTAHLDIRYQFETLELVHRLAQSQELLVVLVLHQINLACELADCLVLLGEDGRTVAAGEAAEVATEQYLQKVYRVPLDVTPHPRSGRPHARADWVFGGPGSGSEAHETRHE